MDKKPVSVAGMLAKFALYQAYDIIGEVEIVSEVLEEVNEPPFDDIEATQYPIVTFSNGYKVSFGDRPFEAIVESPEAKRDELGHIVYEEGKRTYVEVQIILSKM